MDLLKEIRHKLDIIPDESVKEGVRAAVRHIELAEKWLQRGRDERNEDMYNDVIYRANQAFEGMLKEAYSVLKDSDASKLTPNQIEKALIKESVFTPRVMDLFTNYRTEWRNTSTHDHRLFFNDQEALLAIVSVSAFSTILMDQLIEAISSKQERVEVGKYRAEILESIGNLDDKPLTSVVTSILHSFGNELLRSGQTESLREFELLGRLTGFIETLGLGLKVEREPSVGIMSRLRPDVVISRDDEAVIVELKTGIAPNDVLGLGVIQVQRYLEVAGVIDGIIYIPPNSSEDKVVTRVLAQSGGPEIKYRVLLVAPESRSGTS